MENAHKLIHGHPLSYGHLFVNKILPSGIFDCGVTRQISTVNLCVPLLSTIKSWIYVIPLGKISSLSSLAIAPLMLALRVTLRLLEDEPSTHQNVNGLKWFEYMDQHNFKERKIQQISLQISDGPLGYGVINSLLIEGI